jgi:hypothetical protein
MASKRKKRKGYLLKEGQDPLLKRVPKLQREEKGEV